MSETSKQRHRERMAKDPAYREAKRASGRLSAAKARKARRLRRIADPEFDVQWKDLKREEYRRAMTDPSYARKRREDSRKRMTELRRQNPEFRARQGEACRNYYKKLTERPDHYTEQRAKESARYRKMSKEALARKRDRETRSRIRRRTQRLDLSPEQSAVEIARTWAVHEIARQLTAMAGVPHEVDHILCIARGGPDVSWNLRPLTRHENRAKRDRLPTEQELDAVAVLHAVYVVA